MFNMGARVCALSCVLFLPTVANAQCGPVPCAFYPAAPMILQGASRMLVSPGAMGQGRQMIIQQFRQNPVRSPQNIGVWRPYSPPPGYYNPRPTYPGVWYPRQRF